jgi:hypothetical protein
MTYRHPRLTTRIMHFITGVLAGLLLLAVVVSVIILLLLVIRSLQ